MSALRRVTDGVLFQAVLTGSLSFSHIHDLAAVHGQTGWKAWLYPLSVDLLTVAAYRKLMTARRAPALRRCWPGAPSCWACPPRSPRTSSPPGRTLTGSSRSRSACGRPSRSWSAPCSATIP